MKAFKAVSENIPNPLTYTVGKTYSIDSMEICSHGFHFCEKMKDVLKYHEPSKSFKLFEVEVLGKVETHDDKGVTDKMKIIREIPLSEHKMFEVDSNGNEIHYKDSGGYECWKEYDSNGNEIHHKTPSGFERWKEYDSHGNVIHYKTSRGSERWFEYDSNGKEIHYKDSYGNEYWKEYDSNGNVIHFKDSDQDWTITID